MCTNYTVSGKEFYQFSDRASLESELINGFLVIQLSLDFALLITCHWVLKGLPTVANSLETGMVPPKLAN